MNTSSSAEISGYANGNAVAQSFVINLCSSTSPMALAHPSSPELKRFTFFVSRQREDGRERFRLHMGYFMSQEQAEEILGAVRDVYPAAWAGPAPVSGVARRGRIAPVLLAPAVAQAAVARPVEPAVLPVGVAVEAVAASVSPKAGEQRALEQTMSEMRSVLAQLGDDAPTVQHKQPLPSALQPASPAVQPARAVDPPRLQPVAPKVAFSTPAPIELTPVQALQVLETNTVPTLSIATPGAGLEIEPVVRVLTPEDTQTLTDIKLDKANNAPPCFAVQLVWSVTPIDAAAMPHMAIFDAYTLYNVEGNRQGRKWYGLRLGFFSDPNSATQVANYVRGDYTSVAVVPVANKERDNATGLPPVAPVSPNDSAISPPQRAAEHLSTNREAMLGFELVNDDRPVPQKRDLDTPTVHPQAKKPQTQTVQARDPEAVKAAVRARLDKVLNLTDAPAEKPQGKGKRVVARRKPEATHVSDPGRAAVLESTLEMLGASTLTLDGDNGKVIDEAASRRRPDEKKAANSKFSKLLNRLGRG